MLDFFIKQVGAESIQKALPSDFCLQYFACGINGSRESQDTVTGVTVLYFPLQGVN